MREIIFFLSVIFLLGNCKTQKDINIDYVRNRFNSRIDQINIVQYEVRNISKFLDNSVWDNKGIAILDKNPKDSIFGFSFYAIKSDDNQSYIYKDGNGFNINHDDGQFSNEIGGHWVLGSSGGQMVYKDFFKLDSIYKDVKVTQSDTSIIVEYTFDDNIEYDITERSRKLELSKETFLPMMVTTSQQPSIGNKQVMKQIFSNVRINAEVEKDIDQYLVDLNKLDLIINEGPKPSELLYKNIPNIALPELNDKENQRSLFKSKITLIDFWEVWCGPCIKSFPEIEKIKKVYSDDIEIIGIVSDNIEKARKLVLKKELTFINLIGNDNVKQVFDVDSYPSYYLIDTNGIVQYVYDGFSEQIEKDIANLINSK